MQAALPEAVACMRQHMVQRQAAFAVQMQQRLQGTLADLERLGGASAAGIAPCKAAGADQAEPV